MKIERQTKAELEAELKAQGFSPATAEDLWAAFDGRPPQPGDIPGRRYFLSGPIIKKPDGSGYVVNIVRHPEEPEDDGEVE
jgi:hypothetical protein